MGSPHRNSSRSLRTYIQSNNDLTKRQWSGRLVRYEEVRMVKNTDTTKLPKNELNFPGSPLTSLSRSSTHNEMAKLKILLLIILLSAFTNLVIEWFVGWLYDLRLPRLVVYGYADHWTNIGTRQLTSLNNSYPHLGKHQYNKRSWEARLI